MRIYILALLMTILTAKEPRKLDRFIEDYLLIAKSKMESSPTVWQDIKEGYLRSYGIYLTEVLLDSIDAGELSPYHAGIRYFPDIDALRIEVNKGEGFEYIINKKETPNWTKNYFSSTID